MTNLKSMIIVLLLALPATVLLTGSYSAKAVRAAQVARGKYHPFLEFQDSRTRVDGSRPGKTVG